MLRQVRSEQAESTCRFFIFTLSTAGNLFIKFNKFYFYYYSKGIIKSIQTLKNSLHIHVSIRTLCNTRHHACLYVQQLERTNICTGYFQIQCMFLNNILYVNGINIESITRSIVAILWHHNHFWKFWPDISSIWQNEILMCLQWFLILTICLHLYRNGFVTWHALVFLLVFY